MLQISPAIAAIVIIRDTAVFSLRFLVFFLMCTMAPAQSYTSTSATTAWNDARWNNSSDAAPYTSTYTLNNAVSFTSGNYSFAGTGGAINVGNITLANGVTVTFTANAGTLQTAGTVRTINVGSGGTLDFSSQNFSTAAGVGFVKTGAGVLALSGNNYAGGFTLNSGTVILRGVNAMGAGGALTLNGGTVAANATRDLTGKYTGGITIGGDVQFGEMNTNVSLANNTANLTFSDNMALGAASRTLTLGNGGTFALGGVISNTNGGITFAATAGGTGRFDVTNASNSFTGDITITGGEVRFTTDGSLGNAANDVIIDGGRFATLSGASYTLGAGRQLFVGDAAGTSISTPGAATLTYNAAIADKAGETGSWAKQGGGTLALGGVSTYTGDTAINNGTVQLTTGNNRLPTGTTVSLGQAGSANLGILDLNGRDQQIAGLNSVAGSNATTTNNTVTSATAATLTLSGSGSYSYSAGTDANSGVITGAITLVKSGSGTQTFGEANSYTGKTTIGGGFIAGAGESIFGTNPGAFTADQITLNGGGIRASGGSLSFNSNRGITLGSSGGTLDTNGNAITLTNEVTGSGLLTKQGAGTLALNSANTHSGGATITAGSVAVKNTTGSATGSGNVTVTGSTILGTGRISPAPNGSVILGGAAIVSVGDAGDTSGKRLIFTPASGTMSTTFQPNSVLELDLFSGAGSGNNSSIGTAADALQWGGTLALQPNVKLRVNNPNGMTSFAAGDAWKVLDWTTFGGSAPTGTFEATMLELPTLTGLLGWDTSNLYTAGTLSIVAVPEPTRMVLMLLGGAGLAAMRRRR